MGNILEKIVLKISIIKTFSGNFTTHIAIVCVWTPFWRSILIFYSPNFHIVILILLSIKLQMEKVGQIFCEDANARTQWRHIFIDKISEKLGRCGRQNIFWPYLKIWEWEWIFGRAVKAISSLGVRSPCANA